jgi:dTDP-4-amino-4,6-dideoxygalactose transaminase
VLADRKQKYFYYQEHLQDLNGVQFQTVKHGETNYSYFPIILDSEERLLKVEKALNAENIFPRRYFYPSVNTYDAVVNYRECPISESIAEKILCLPLYYSLDQSDALKVCEIVNKN